MAQLSGIAHALVRIILGTGSFQRIGVLLRPAGASARWHWEMAQLSGIARALVRIIFGTDLPTGTHREALQHYRRATQLNPTRMIHRWALLPSQ